MARSGSLWRKPLQQIAVGDETRAKRVRETYGKGLSQLQSPDRGDTFFIEKFS
jgi:hypothetical protein